MKVEIKMVIEIDAEEWNRSYGIDPVHDSHAAKIDAQMLYGAIAAEAIQSHDQCRRIVTVNGKMQPTV